MYMHFSGVYIKEKVLRAFFCLGNLTGFPHSGSLAIGERKKTGIIKSNAYRMGSGTLRNCAEKICMEKYLGL